MVEAADFSDRYDVADTGRHNRTRNRRVLVQRQMRPRFFVVHRQNASELNFAPATATILTCWNC
jgi:hypothetical protein